jgi:pimeloyl-ACP methyl ester carboxylesterase
MFFIQGADDLNTPTSLVEEYFAKIRAPAKGLEVLPDVGHFVVAHHERLLAFLNERVRPLVLETAAGGTDHL